MNFGSDWHGAGAVDERTAASLIDLALERGVNLIDTADVYGRGASEELLGRVLKGRRERVLLASKVLGRMDPLDSSTCGLSARWIEKALEGSLERLRTDHLDLYMPHGWDPAVPIHETMEALDRAVRAGKVRALGCSNFSGAQLKLALEASAGARPEFDQVQYSLVHREPEADLVPAARRAGVSLLAWSPLAGGLLSGKYAAGAALGRRNDPDAFPRVRAEPAAAMVEMVRRCAELDRMTPAQAALSWTLSKPCVASAVVGARAVAQLEETLTLKPLSRKSLDLLERSSELCR